MLTKVLYLKKKLLLKRKARIRGKIFGTSDRPRLSIFKSNKHFYAQVIDDTKNITLCSIGTKKFGLTNNMENVSKLGIMFTDILNKHGVKSVIFDRNGYLYHGVVASFVESLRKNGLVV